MRLLLKRYAPMLIPCALAVLIISLMCFGISERHLILFSREGGLIEDLTAILFALAAVGSLYVAWHCKSCGWGLYAFFMAVASLREIDAHKMWTTMSIFKSRFYVSPDVPFGEKVAGAVIILILLYAIFNVLKYVRASVSQALAGHTQTLLVYTALGFLAVAKSLDSFFRIFPSFEASRTHFEHYMFFGEESLELGAALLLMLVPLMALYKKRLR